MVDACKRRSCPKLAVNEIRDKRSELHWFHYGQIGWVKTDLRSLVKTGMKSYKWNLHMFYFVCIFIREANRDSFRVSRSGRSGGAFYRWGRGICAAGPRFGAAYKCATEMNVAGEKWRGWRWGLGWRESRGGGGGHCRDWLICIG